VTDQAFVTLATDDVYCQGALVLGQSVLRSVFDEVIEVDALDSADSVRLALLQRPELGVTFTKLHCWTLTHYSKCVFMDADTLVLCNVDELFDREEFSAAPDSGWPDCFNSGVFVFRPSLKTYNLLLQFAAEHGSFDGGDQGLLNSFFSNWATADIGKHLPFIYNLSSSAVYTYVPAFNHFGRDAKVVHFLGATKPWNYKYNLQTKRLSFLALWWNIYSASILPLLEKLQKTEQSESEERKNNQITVFLLLCFFLQNEVTHSVSELSIHLKPEEPNPEDERRKWEEGRMDYMGKDAFEHIKKKLDTFLL
uniref:glycogenin glucosyltransferase n=1 Tax=Anas platyrhynchos TaxID=8839 RepID=A0A8B9SGG0_ANAPL